jgi:hypothetical protein
MAHSVPRPSTPQISVAAARARDINVMLDRMNAVDFDDEKMQ